MILGVRYPVVALVFSGNGKWYVGIAETSVDFTSLQSPSTPFPSLLACLGVAGRVRRSGPMSWAQARSAQPHRLSPTVVDEPGCNQMITHIWLRPQVSAREPFLAVGQRAAQFSGVRALGSPSVADPQGETLA
ncbi:hypothetical protein VTO42DRAFT_3824 [Malbranchea cinnamomea]